MARSETSATDWKIWESASNQKWSQLSKREPCIVPAIKKKSAIEDTVIQKHTCKTIVPTYFTTKAPPMTITPNVRAAKKGRFESNFCVTLKSLFQLTEIDSMLSYVCSVKDHRWHQMWIQKEAHKAQTSVSLMFIPHFDVICDKFLWRRAATWNPIVIHDKKAKCCSWWHNICVCPPTDH